VEVVVVPLGLTDVEGHVDVAGGDLLGLHDVHVLQLLDEFVKLLNGLLVLVRHHSLDVGDLLVEMGASHVEVLVPDFVEEGVLTGKSKVGEALIRHAEVLPHLLVRLHDCVLDRDRGHLNSVELIEQAFIVLIDAEGGNGVHIPVNHDEGVYLRLLAPSSSILGAHVYVERILVDS